MKLEIKNVLNYKGLYVATNDGRIFGLTQGCELKGTLRGGYKAASLSKNGARKTYPIHRLVYEAFKGKKSDSLVIDHIDGDKLNNHIDNLKQITTRSNTSKGWRAKTSYPTGVTFLKQINKYKAEIQTEGERFYLGVYDNVDEAEKAYQETLRAWKTEGKKPDKRDRSVKHCTHCNKTMSVEKFYYVKNHGYSWLCKDCHKKEINRRRIKKRN